MIVVSTSPFNIFMLRKKNTWYTVADGNWTDPNIWKSNALYRRNVTYPRDGDDVYIFNSVTIDLNIIARNVSIANIYISGTFIVKQTFATGYEFNVLGDIQSTGILDMTSPTTVNINLYGVSSFITTLIQGTVSSINYMRNGDQDIIPLTNYYNVKVGAGGTKYLRSNLTISGTLTTNTNAKLEMGIYNYTGGFANNGTISKTGDGAVVFHSIGQGGTIRFAAGNPTIEFTGNLATTARLIAPDWQTGTNTVTFSTNTQILKVLVGSWTVNNPIIVKGNITVTNTTEGGNTSIIYINNTIDGQQILGTDNPTFANSGYLGMMIPPNFMATAGIFNWNASSDSNMVYMFNGNYTLPYTTYSQLTLQGTGNKSLSGNTTVNICNNNATLLFGNYNYTGGLNMIGASSNLTKTGPGAVIFSGVVAGAGTIDFSGGNPTVEFRAGFRFAFMAYISGSGTHTFTTANQIIKDVTGVTTFNCPVIVSGAITVTAQSESAGNNCRFIMASSLNGTVSSSSFDNQGVLTLMDSNAPMLTGLFSSLTQVAGASSETLTIYGSSGAQDIYATTYKNLTLQGNGSKKLLGNVSVSHIYTLTSPATLNTNGFLLTNP